MSEIHQDYVIEQFTLKENDIKELAQLITESFLEDEAAQEEGASIIFNEETFRTMFTAPSIDRELFLRARYKKTNEIIGFIGMIPREVAYGENKYNFAIPAWLAIHPAHQRKGIGTSLGMKMFHLVKDRGYDGGFSLFEPSQKGFDTAVSALRKLNITYERLVTINQFIIRVFDAEAITKVVKVRWFEKLFFKLKEKIIDAKNPRIRLYHEDDFEDVYALILGIVSKNQVAIVPNKKDVKWVLNRPGVLCVVHENSAGKVDGFIYAWEFLLAGFGNKVPFGWLETVHLYNLSIKQGRDLAAFLCKEAYKMGWKGLQTPFIPYFDPKPLKKANFIFFGKKMFLDFVNIKNVDMPEKVDSFYFDWR